jgi:hypothetical protein
VAEMLDGAALKYIRDAGQVTCPTHPIQRRIVAALELPRDLDNENVRKALVYSLMKKWKAP